MFGYYCVIGIMFQQMFYFGIVVCMCQQGQVGVDCLQFGQCFIGFQWLWDCQYCDFGVFWVGFGQYLVGSGIVVDCCQVFGVCFFDVFFVVIDYQYWYVVIVQYLGQFVVDLVIVDYDGVVMQVV